MDANNSSCRNTARRDFLLAVIGPLIAASLITLAGGTAKPLEGAPQPPNSPDRILSESRGGAVRSIVAIGASYLEVPRLESLYRSLLTPDLPPRYAIFVTAYPDEESANSMSDAKPFEGLSFDFWRDQLLKAKRDHPWRAARLIATAEGAVVQVAKEDHYFSTVLSGKDPTRLSVAGTNYELLQAEYRNELRGEPAFLACLRADREPTVDGVRLLAEAIRAKLPAERLSITVRPDVWFVYDDFPVWFPFSTQQQPPTWEEFRQTRVTNCDNVFLPLHCSSRTMPASPRLRWGQAVRDLH